MCSFHYSSPFRSRPPIIQSVTLKIPSPWNFYISIYIYIFNNIFVFSKLIDEEHNNFCKLYSSLSNCRHNYFLTPSIPCDFIFQIVKFLNSYVLVAYLYIILYLCSFFIKILFIFILTPSTRISLNWGILTFSLRLIACTATPLW